ncbi:MAG: hydroxylamine reductase, partial [Desulfobacteraceae bacterium]|nr:hydroxylamine reductase [Desulfobacteraceae bacterium]
MFCFQCQEAAKGTGCTVKGMCGKENDTANLQDLLIYNLKGISVIAGKAKAEGAQISKNVGEFVAKGLFTTITNANFNDENLIDWINKAQAVKKELFESVSDTIGSDLDESATWYSNDSSTFLAKSEAVGVLATENEDVRSLRELLILGLKGISAYADHAAVLGVEKDEIYDFLYDALASTTQELSVDEMVGKVLKAGEVAVTTMAALDEANTSTYGHPELSQVNIGVGTNPGILISGHDLKDMEELLQQTQGTGVDVYTHGEMLPAHYYPAFKKYDHLKGNYGSSWWHQNKEFESFNG